MKRRTLGGIRSRSSKTIFLVRDSQSFARSAGMRNYIRYDAMLVTLLYMFTINVTIRYAYYNVTIAFIVTSTIALLYNVDYTLLLYEVTIRYNNVSNDVS